MYVIFFLGGDANGIKKEYVKKLENVDYIDISNFNCNIYNKL